MSQVLVAGANTTVPTTNLRLRVVSQSPIDCAAYRLAANGKVRGDGDMIFYGQTQSDDGRVRYTGHETDCAFDVDLPSQPTAIDKIALAFSSDRALSALGDIELTVFDGSTPLAQCRVTTTGRSEKALILAELYRRQWAWKLRFVAQGFDGGLKPLSEYYGVEIADDAPPPSPTPQTLSQTSPTPTTSTTPTPPPAPKSTLNLSKVTLTKQQASISLSKRDNFGDIAINLNWNQRAAMPSRGTLSQLFGRSSGGIDLDLGAFVALQNGNKYVIQALGDTFGNLDAAPFVRLRADDRTGASASGEWLDINGRYWQQIREVLIYAFIYQGIPNWAQTDGIVTLHVPDQPLIETHLTEGTNHLGMCAIARLINQNGSIQVERVNQYFDGHKSMDQQFGWNFNWTRGRK